MRGICRSAADADSLRVRTRRFDMRVSRYFFSATFFAKSFQLRATLSVGVCVWRQMLYIVLNSLTLYIYAVRGGIVPCIIEIASSVFFCSTFNHESSRVITFLFYYFGGGGRGESFRLHNTFEVVSAKDIDSEAFSS
jgi:FtsH-binding integral membrane protein